MVSLMVHGIFALIAIFLITIAVMSGEKKEEPVDFLAGGGGGGKSNDAKKATQRRSVALSQPKARVTSTISTSSVVLPDSPVISSNTPSLLSLPTAGGKGGGEGGLSGKGRGGLMGNGNGAGVGAGNMAGFVAMFGKRLQAKKLGVVMDISKSMHPFLPTVVKEANKVGQGAPIVMSYGCGASQPRDPKQRLSRVKFEEAKGKDFDHFWHRIPLGSAADKNTADVDLSKPIPLKETYEVVNGRKDTFYMEKSGVGNAWAALVADELRTVDAVYWFADFKDPMDSETMEDLLRELQRRKQKLYVHASGNDARALSMLMEKVVKPSGGEEIKADLTKNNPPAAKKPAMDDKKEKKEK